MKFAEGEKLSRYQPAIVTPEARAILQQIAEGWRKSFAIAPPQQRHNNESIVVYPWNDNEKMWKSLSRRGDALARSSTWIIVGNERLDTNRDTNISTLDGDRKYDRLGSRVEESVRGKNWVTVDRDPPTRTRTHVIPLFCGMRVRFFVSYRTHAISSAAQKEPTSFSPPQGPDHAPARIITHNRGWQPI